MRSDRFGQVRSNERRFNEQSAVRGERSTSVNVRSGSEPRAEAIKGNNPMRIRESASRANAPRAGEQAQEIKGNNPMKAEKSTAAASERGTAAAGSERGTVRAGARGNARATTGSAPRQSGY